MERYFLVLSSAKNPSSKRKCSINIDFIADKCFINARYFPFLEIPGQISILPILHLKLTDRFLSFDPAQHWQPWRSDQSHWSRADSLLLDSTDDH